MTDLDIQPSKLAYIEDKQEQEELETQRLLHRLQTELGRIGLVSSQLVQGSLMLALDLHQEDRRTYEPYVNHLVRVALNLTELGIEDENTVAAALLHDSVEDHPLELASKVPEYILPPNEQEPRVLGYAALRYLTNEEVATVVLEVSRPQVTAGQDKNAIYAEHIRRLVTKGSLKAQQIKVLGDFVDNTDAHGQEAPKKRRSLDYKQIEAYPIVIRSLDRLQGTISPTSIESVQELLRRRHTGAMQRLQLYTRQLRQPGHFSASDKNHSLVNAQLIDAHQ